MSSIYTKAPTFVDNSQSNLATIDAYDKEMQRINQDYAVAGKAARDFKSKVDILKMDEKAYFDEKYNNSIQQFSTNIDLTKRGQVNQVETVLTDITRDPIINTAIQSTQNYKKVLAMRNELKTNPKYMKMHKAADESAEQQIMNSYLTSNKLGEAFTLTGPIITMDSDKLIADTVKSIQYEENSTNFGPVTVFEKYKSVGKTTGAVYQALTSNPEALAAERNNFNYLYRTPEAKKQLGQQLAASKKEHMANITDRLKDINAGMLVNKNNPIAYTTLSRELQNLTQEQNTLKNLNPEDEGSIFNAYLLKKSLDAGKSNQENKALKMVADEYTKYFDTRGDVKFKKELELAKFKNQIEQQAIKNDLSQQALDLKRQDVGVDAAGKPIGAASNVITVNPTTTFDPDFDIVKDITSREINLKTLNDKDGIKLIQLMKDSGDTPLNKFYTDYKKRGLIVDHSTSGLFSQKEFQNILNLKTALINSSGQNMTKELKDMEEILNRIADRNQEYELVQIGKEKAEKDAGAKDGNTYNNLGFKTDIGEKYEANLKANLQAQDITKEVIFSGLNKTEDRKNNYNAEVRTKIKLLAEQNGLNDSTNRYALNNTVGNKTGYFGNKTITKEQSERVDWENSIISVTPGKNNSVVKLKLSSKDKDKSLNLDGFKDGYAYLTIDNQTANELLAQKGLSVQSFLGGFNVYNHMNQMGWSLKDKNRVLGNNSVLGVKSLPLGNTRASYQIEARDDNEYYINMNVAGKQISTRTAIPKEFLKGIEERSSELYRQMKSSPNFSTEAFNKEVIKYITGEINR